MTIKELIERLKEYPEDTRVLVWDCVDDKPVNVTGLLYDPKTSELEFCGDGVS